MVLQLEVLLGQRGHVSLRKVTPVNTQYQRRLLNSRASFRTNHIGPEMDGFLVLLAAGLYLCLQNQVNAESALSRSDIESAVVAAKANVDSAYEYSRRASVERVRRNTASPSDILRLLKQPVGATRSAVRAADYMFNTIELIKMSHGRRQKRSINATDLLSEDDLGVIANLTGCSPRHRRPSCRTTLNVNTFRTASSVCNNRENTRWGSANTPFARWLPAEYQDGVSLPQGWDPERRVNQHILPLVREVSNRILRTAHSHVESDPFYTHMVVLFGQWTDHDLSFTPSSPVIRSLSNGIDCDESCERTEPCFPIQVPANDPRRRSQECIPFFRSAPACGSGGTGHIFGARTVRQQMNTLTAFIDVGQVYGADEVKARSLRDLSTDRGLLKVNTRFTDHGRELLSFSSNKANMCATRGRITNDSKVEEVPCFLAGDDRSNENIGLVSLYTMMMREHNRLARALAKLNPHWSGERIYQEARKIMGGYFQVITYRDYLQHIVGTEIYETRLSTYPGYDESVDPSISNVFATAAYRFAHAMVQPFMFRLDEQYQEHRDYPSPMMQRGFFTPWRIIFEGGLDPVLRGLVGRPAKMNTQDHIMHEDLRDRLFQFAAEMTLDLGALNMQRSRDHGLPGYNKWRKFCGLSQPQDVHQLAVVLQNIELATKLLELYGHPDNIDVWLGGIAEPFVRGGRVGPVFACLISTQFERIREGDRLWWENDGVFTEAQRESLRGATLSRIICDNTGITEVPARPFHYRPRGSGYTQCADIPTFDLRPWQDAGGPRGPAGPPGPPGPPGPVEKVAFSVRLGSDFPKGGTPILFRDVIYNGQNSYDTRTGLFTCERPGVYEFQFHCVINEHAGGVALLRNQHLVVHSWQSAYTTASGSAYMKLERGDIVWLMANYGGRGVTKDSFFSGHLLFIE